MEKIIRITVLITLWLCGLLTVGSLYAQVIEDQLVEQVYANGGMTLICGETFQPGDRARVTQVYTERQMRRHFDCRTNRQCRNDPDYVAAADDLHNYFLTARRVDADRRGTMFNELPDSIETTNCGYRISFQVFDPPAESRGKIARAMLYMHAQHGLPMIGAPLDLFQRWSDEVPPDTHEQQRNDAIEQIQGIRNPYIDDPSAVHNILAPSSAR